MWEANLEPNDQSLVHKEAFTRWKPKTHVSFPHNTCIVRKCFTYLHKLRAIRELREKHTWNSNAKETLNCPEEEDSFSGTHYKVESLESRFGSFQKKTSVPSESSDKPHRAKLGFAENSESLPSFYRDSCYLFEYYFDCGRFCVKRLEACIRLALVSKWEAGSEIFWIRISFS